MEKDEVVCRKKRRRRKRRKKRRRRRGRGRRVMQGPSHHPYSNRVFPLHRAGPLMVANTTMDQIRRGGRQGEATTRARQPSIDAL